MGISRAEPRTSASAGKHARRTRKSRRHRSRRRHAHRGSSSSDDEAGADPASDRSLHARATRTCGPGCVVPVPCRDVAWLNAALLLAWAVFNVVVLAYAAASERWKGCGTTVLILQLWACVTQLSVAAGVVVLDVVDEQAHAAKRMVRQVLKAIYIQGPVSLGIYSFFLFQESCRVEHYGLSVLHVVLSWLAALVLFWQAYAALVMTLGVPLREQGKVVVMESAVLFALGAATVVVGAVDIESGAELDAGQCLELGNGITAMGVLTIATAVCFLLVTLPSAQTKLGIPGFFEKAAPCYCGTATVVAALVVTVALVAGNGCSRAGIVYPASVTTACTLFLLVPFTGRTIGSPVRPLEHWALHRSVSSSALPLVVTGTLSMSSAIACVTMLVLPISLDSDPAS